MKLTDTDIGEFCVLWKQETGQNISFETAQEYAQDILALVSIATEPFTKARDEKPP